MSLMRLLAAGRSIMGIRKKPGPYRMSQENLLPKFAPVHKPAIAVMAVKPPETAVSATSLVSKASTAKTAVTGTAAVSRRSELSEPAVGRLPILSRLASRLTMLTRRGKQRPVRCAASDRHVQTELSLDGVKVVRNDLKDCDFDVVPVRAQRPLQAEQTGAAGQQPRALGMVWNRLSARLLRQAANDFNSVQKERGKLLSQAGHGHGSDGGA